MASALAFTAVIIGVTNIIFIKTEKSPEVLMYHSISDRDYQVTARNFERQIKHRHT